MSSAAAAAVGATAAGASATRGMVASATAAAPPPPQRPRRVCNAPQPPLIGPRGYFSGAVLATAPGLVTTSIAAFGASAVGAAFAAAPSILLAPGIRSGAGMRLYAPNATVVHATPPPSPGPTTPPEVLPLPCGASMWEATVAPWVRAVLAGGRDFPNGGVLAVDHAYYGGAAWRGGSCGRAPLFSFLSPTPRIVNAAVAVLASFGREGGAAASEASPTAPKPTEATVGAGLVAVHLRILPGEAQHVNVSTVVATALAAIENATVFIMNGTANAVPVDGGIYNNSPGGMAAVRGKAVLAAARGIYVAFTPSSLASAGTAAALRAKYGRKVFWYSREAALGGAASMAAVDATVVAAATAATAAIVAAGAAGGNGTAGTTTASAVTPAAAAAAVDAHPVDWMYGPSMVDLWACVLAEHFIGRDASSFSGNIRMWRRGTLRSEVEGGGVRVWTQSNPASLLFSMSAK